MSGKFSYYDPLDYITTEDKIAYVISAGTNFAVLNSFHFNLGLGWCHRLEPENDSSIDNPSTDRVADFILDYGVLMRIGENGNGLIWLQSNYRVGLRNDYIAIPFDISLAFGTTFGRSLY
jgi:hypothetical protein